LSEMKADILPFVINDMDFGLRQWGAFAELRVRPDDVVGSACRHTLGELTAMIGIEFPSCFLLVSPPDSDPYSVGGAIIRPVHSAVD